jgi:branched-chain amino acid transport system ATP-binding protein
MSAFLALHGAETGYGKRRVLEEIDLALDLGETLALLGHNGAGKSTLLKLLFGLQPLWRGTLRLEGRPITPRPEAMAAAGIALVPEGRGVFPNLLVREIFTLALWQGRVRGAEQARRIDEVVAFFPPLAGFIGRRAGTLSGGQQQMVALARALLLQPRFLLLDEPSLGLAPKTFQDLIRPLRELQKERGFGMLLVEQNVVEALAVADRAVVLKSGRIVFTGDPQALADPARLITLF